MPHITKLYQLFDKVAGSVVGPIMSHKREQPAIRIFHGWLQNKETGPGMHPHDFELLELGNQDEETGEISAERRVVATGAAWADTQSPVPEDVHDIEQRMRAQRAN